MNKGFTLVEIMLSIALLSAFVPAFIYVFSFSSFSVIQSNNYSQAYTLGQEQIEAILNLKSLSGANWDWVNTPINTNLGEYYQPSETMGNWTLGNKTTSPLQSDKFTKLVEITDIKRCGNAICNEPWGIVDLYSRKITVTINWKENGQDTNIKLLTIVNNI